MGRDGFVHPDPLCVLQFGHYGWYENRRELVRPLLAVVVPIVGIVLLVAVWAVPLGPVLVGLVAVVLAGAVLAAVHHAEVVAHRVGEPFGSLVLAVAVTVIEVALIVTLMVGGGDTPPRSPATPSSPP